VNPNHAEKLIKQQAVTEVHGRIVACDGGAFVLLFFIVSFSS
jgi:hypothetical protein